MRNKKEIEREINIIKAEIELLELRGETKDNEDKVSKTKTSGTKVNKTKVSKTTMKERGKLKWNRN